MLSVTYNDRAPWPIAADAHGFSAVPRNVASAPNSDNGTDWRASAFMGGSPGADDPEIGIQPVMINEVYSHSVPPEIDWVELFNPNAVEVSIGGWFLSDDAAAPKKFRIPDGTTIPAGAYRVFSESNFNADPLSFFSFSLDSAGDSIYLSSGDSGTNLTGYSHGFAFGAAATGTGFGRYVISTGEEQFPAQIYASSNAPNPGPAIGPVVIQEINYHPDSDGDEFIELRNITSGDVMLFDPANPVDTWRINGLGFTFPTNVFLPAQGLLIVTAADPVAFRAKYNVAAVIQIFGQFSGVLQDSGERLELQRPGLPDTNGIPPYITVDEVRYNDKLPWPPAADGSGASLQRRVATAYGNDPINWEAATPTPGANFMAGQGPIITAQPQNQSVLSSDTAQFAVSASGPGPLFYQWLFNGDLIANATNTTLIIFNVQPAHAGNYSVVVFNDAGSVVSASARLVVNRRPTIMTQPTNTLVRPGSNAVLSVSAVGNGLLRYQWRRNGEDLAFATNATLTITNAQSGNTGTYVVIVTDTFASIESTAVTLDLAIDPIIVQQPLSQSVVEGGTVTLSIVITNTANLPITYRWRRGTGFVASNYLYSRVDYFTLTNAQPGSPNTNVTVVIQNPAKLQPTLSAVASLNVLTDSDHDGLPDLWEAANGLGTNNPGDASGDADGDTLLNWQEYVAGTDPTNALSYLKVEPSETIPGGQRIRFSAVSNRTYRVVYKNALEEPAWVDLATFPARTTNRIETAVDLSPSAGRRFYRLITPAR